MTFRKKIWMAVYGVCMWQVLRRNYVHVCTVLGAHTSGVWWGGGCLIVLFIKGNKCMARHLHRSYKVCS